MNMASRGLLVAGELNVDLILNRIEGFPEVCTEVIAGDMNLKLGSSSAITAANASAIGIPTEFCGVVGGDIYGQLVIRELQQKGVGTHFVRTSSQHRTGITVILNYGQESANITYCGAMEAMRMEDLPWSEIRHFRHFHLSNFFLQKGIRPDITSIFRRIKAAGLSTSLDLQWDISSRWEFDFRECLPYVDIFLPNEAELLALTRCTRLEDAVVAIRPYIDTLVIKLGHRGSLGIRGDQSIRLDAFPVDNFVDAVGAGDSFNAGFLKKYLDEAPLRECLEYGNLIGAISTTAAGGTTAFSHRASIRKKILNLLQPDRR